MNMMHGQMCIDKKFREYITDFYDLLPGTLLEITMKSLILYQLYDM
jgi:hypothetical protein